MMKPVYPHAGRDNNFHLIRHAAAIGVILTHSFSIVTGRFDSEPLASLLDHSIGNYAVDVFFVLSGFLIAQSLNRDGDLVRFAVSRVLRIFPALALATLACALVLGPITTTMSPTEYFSSRQLFDYLFGSLSTLNTSLPLPGVFEGLPEVGRVNVPLWTLKFELFAYVSLAIVFVLSRALWSKRLVVLLSAMLAMYLGYRLLFPWPANNVTPFSNLMHFLLSFYLGVAAFAFRNYVPLHPVGIACLFFLAYLGHDSSEREFLEKVAIAYTVLWLGFCSRPLIGEAFHKVDYSFGLYIMAFPVQQTVRLFVPDITPILLFIVALTLTVPLAALSWHLIERPSLAKKATVASWLSSRIGRGRPHEAQPHGRA